ncbi:MAG: efflux RND transporter permease subunit [Myxococcota bacterium]
MDRQPASGLLTTAIDRPVTVFVGVLLVTLFGTLTFFSIPIQLTPDISRPNLTVNTVWPGASPVEVESEILEEQEEVLKSLPGLVRMVSNANVGQGSVSLELEVGTDLQESLVRASNLLSQVPRYPDGADQPVLNTANSTGPPIGVVLMRNSSGGPMNENQTWVEETIIPLIERIPGISEAGLRGGQETEVEIAFDPVRIASRGMTLSEIRARVLGELRDLSGGDVTLGKRRLIVRTPVAPDEPSGLENIVLSVQDGGVPVRLGDVATVRLGFRKPSFTVYADGRETLAALVFRESGTNVLEVTEELRETVAMIQREHFDPLGLDIVLVSDQTGYIYGALELVQQNLLLGGLFAIIVLLVFLQNVAASLVVAVAIPVCVVATALGMALLGRSINVVSLAGMAFAVGMVVDNAIVVLENIETWRSKGYGEKVAAALGAKEVWGAILASTATTAAVFIPIIGWQDEVGELLRDIAIALSIAVIVSLFVSVLVIPSFSASILRLRHTGSFSVGPLARVGSRFRTRVGEWVRAIASKTSRALALTLTVVGLTAAAAVALLPPLEYLPTGNRNLVFGIVIPPAGYSVEEMDAVARWVQKRMVEHTGEAKDGVPAINRSFFVAAPGRGFMGAEAVRAEDIGGVQKYVQSMFAKIPGVFGIAVRSSLFGRSIGGGRSIDVEISGRDLDEVLSVGGRVMGLTRSALPNAQAQPSPGLDLTAPELHVEPKREQLTQLGMNGSELGLVVDALVDGARIGEFGREGEPRLDVVLRPLTGGIREPSELAAAPVATPSGQVVPLSVLADIREELGPTQIQRVERRRAISVQVRPPEDVPLETAIERIRSDVIGPLEAEGVLAGDVQIRLEGTAGDLESAKVRFGYVLILAVVISFLLMAALFEDFIAPSVVMVTIPLAAGGGMLGLRLVDATLSRQPLDLVTALGFIILVGVVVNNAILVVDGALSRLRDGSELADAVAGAVEGRVRPIFMSALTSLAGLLPLVLFPGAGSELYRGIGAVVLGGLALSTVLTLFVVPALFVLLWTPRIRRQAAVAPAVRDAA